MQLAGGSESDKPARKKQLPNERLIEGWHKTLLKNEKMMAWLRTERGIKRKVIKQMKVGYRTDYPTGPNGQEARLTLPVYEDGELVNVRYYKRGASEGKMKNHTGHGSAALYGTDALERDEPVFLDEGEMDCLLARSLGLNAMTHTAGAKAWNNKWSPMFEGKVVYICYDCDSVGRGGAARTAASLRRYAEAVYIINLNLPTKGADLTDYIVKQGNSLADLRDLMKDAEATTQRRVKRTLDVSSPQHVTLEHSMHQDLTDTAIYLTATVSGKANETYNVPRKYNLACDMGWTEEKCNNCALSSHNGSMDVEIEPYESVLLELLEDRKSNVERVMLDHASVQSGCKRVEQDVDQTWAVEELVVIPNVDDRGEDVQSPVERRVYNVGAHDTPVNTTVQLTGINTADPRTQRATLLTWECVETKLSLDKFEMTPATYQALKAFRPKHKQSPMDKLEAIARDLAANVTHIYDRPMLHVAYDLVWHSVLDFHLDGQPVGKGWLELLVIGDTRTGKSLVAEKMTEHYQAGKLTSCEGVSFAGLIGGQEKMGSTGRFGTKWGVIPLHDRRLVVLDEVSGMADDNIIGRMSSVRSSGIAQITKMGGQETSARTRLIWLSNPVEGTIGSMARGAIDGIKKLVPAPEDQARFDFAMSVARGEVSSEVINTTFHENVKHQYTSSLCALLVAWVWSRKAEDVWWEEGAEDLVFALAEELGHEYLPDPPLVQTENMRMKLARLSVAVAARLFSTDRSGEKVLVAAKHVHTAVAILNRLYGTEAFGYQQHSKRELRAAKQATANRREVLDLLRNDLDAAQALIHLMSINRFKLRDITDFGNMEPDAARALQVELMKMKMLRGSSGFLYMQPQLMEVLKYIENELEEE